MKAYSIDLREGVLAACKGVDQEVAKQFSVSPAWVRRLKQLCGSAAILSRAPAGSGTGGHKIDRQKLAHQVKERPDATLVELRDRWVVRGGVKVTRWAISKALRKLELTFRKGAWVCPKGTRAAKHKNPRHAAHFL